METAVYRERLNRLQAKMRERQVGIYVATRQATLSWLLGSFAPWRTAVAVPASGDPHAIIWRLDYERIKSETWMRHCRSWGDGDTFAEAVVDVIRELGGERDRIGLDLGSPVSQQVAPGLLLASEFAVLNEKLPEAHLDNAVPWTEEVLSIKDQDEIARLRKAAQIADIGMAAAMEALRPGVTENAVAGEVERAIRLAGSEWAWSGTQGTEVGSGLRTGFKRGVTQPATEKIIRAGEMVIVDLHTMYRLYLGDLAGNFYMGKNPPRAVAELAACWEETVAFLLNAMKPGERIADLVDRAFSIMEKHGMAEWGLRAFGHGLGTCARTPPYMVQGNQAELKANMVLALGTHLYNPEVGGMRLELPVLITESGAEPLSKWPSRLHLIDC